MGLAIAAGDPGAILIAAVLGWVTAIVGAGYGLIIGTVIAFAASPLRDSRQRIARLRVVWALLAGGSALALSAALFGWNIQPGRTKR